MYVLCCEEHLRDGKEEWHRVVADLDAAQELIDRRVNGFAGSNYTFRLYKLGREIKMRVEKVTVEQPSVTKSRIVVT